MRIDRKKLNRDGLSTAWKQVYSGDVRPTIYWTCGESHASVTVNTIDNQRLDVMFTRSEVEAMLAIFCRDSSTVA